MRLIFQHGLGLVYLLAFVVELNQFKPRKTSRSPRGQSILLEIGFFMIFLG